MKIEKWTDWDNEMLKSVINILQEWENNYTASEENGFAGIPSYVSWIKRKAKVLKGTWFKRLFNLV